MHHSANIAFLIAVLIGTGALCQWLAWRMRLPAILPLLLVGLVLGPGLGVLNPDEALGELLFPFVSLAVSIILFEGSLTLRFSDIGQVTRVIRNLTSIGVLVTWGVMSLAAHHLVGLSWPLAALFGALVTVTGPTVIVPMLRSIRPSERVSSILRWEGILVDPIGAALAVLVFEFILTGAEAKSLLEFGKVVVLGAVWGVAGGTVLSQVLKRHWLPDYLFNYFSLACVLLVFTASNLLGQESGLIAVTVMGMVLANTRGLDVSHLLSFKEDLTLLLISVLFILLAARLNVDQLVLILVPALLVLGVALFVARPLSVLLSSIGTSASAREMTLLSWVAPRGIVAAAISSLFALRLEADGNTQAALLVPLTFTIIIGTVVIYSLTAGWLAVRLGLSSRNEQGVLIIGANRVGVALGKALKDLGIKVKLVDADRRNLQQARMAGLDTFYGNPLSEYADRYLEMSGYTHLLAVSRRAEFNAMVCAQYRHEFGSRDVFTIQADGTEDDEGRQGLTSSLRFNLLFPLGTTWTKLASMLGQDGEIRATELTEEFDAEAFNATWGSDAIAMFALDEQGTLQVFRPGRDWSPKPGWTLVNLLPASAIEEHDKLKAERRNDGEEAPEG